MTPQPPTQPPTEDTHVGLLDADEGAHDTIVLEGSNRGASVEPGSFFKLASAIAVLVAGALATYVVPSLEWAQPWSASEDYVLYWNLVGREVMGQGDEADKVQEQADAFGQLARKLADDPEEAIADGPVEPRPIVDPKIAPKQYPDYREHQDDKPTDPPTPSLEGTERIAPFLRALTHTELGLDAKVTRVAHWGDSVLGNDGITAAIRNHMQARFGDAGHGFHSLSQYDPSYRHKGISFREKSTWTKCYIINRCMKTDGRYGYGGTTVWSAGGAESVFGTAAKGKFGRAAARFEVWYLAGPKGGNLRIKVDKQAPHVIDTRAENSEDRWQTFDVPDGAHRFSVRAAGGGRARAYGVVLEREGPGVVWDGMALIGAFTNRMNEQNPAHLQAQIDHRDPDLLVFMFGGNDMIRERAFRKSMELYEKEYGDVVRRARGEGDQRPCVIMSVIDHGERRKGRVITRPIVPRMVEAQRNVARAQGCAFFDTYQAMGGAGSMALWSKMNPRLASGDLAHPTHHGHKVIGALFYGALMKAYASYRRQLAGTAVGE
ncbi:MAG: GDSL-type esterase/lipase family protein [Nannocystaceae bacterium]